METVERPIGVAKHLPSGVLYCPEFITSADEETLVQWLDERPWDETLKRRVQHFGYRYDYKARTVAPESYIGPLPKPLNTLCDKLTASGCFSSVPDQVIANEYWPGQGIGAHVDCVPCFGDTIVSVSLLSDCEITFADKGSKASCSLRLEARSALILKGDARYRYTHRIPARKSDVFDGKKVLRSRRISLTFRQVVG